ncbi:hypothetical protein CkaCkLH20_06706 [Colletotrichum karsti]|uniref:Uncharacterized protein n=1 Tax=Colletotrichum karsti TaxID=1095194 RepID=A0A9P6LH04_9PEZI|nr:uncharacterized protein CkaCkLH20_06706 [Colletotrichum karsti]KAF9875774.1 hypothetical protein CkaCkLH20_06706 [Colletotrichum karsti]
MTATPEFSAVKEESELEALEKTRSFYVELASNDANSGFHTKNDPSSPYQRKNVVQRKGAVDVKCTCVDIVHGRWGPDEPDTAATLLVLGFRFDSRKRARRVALAHMEFAFFGNDGDRNNPEVAAISYDNSYSLAPSRRTESTTTGTEGTIGSGIPGAELSGTVKWERTSDEETTDAAHLVGSIDRLGAPVGPFNAATWTLKENATTKKGVPAAMRVGILLKRPMDDDEFYCTVKVETEVDLKTRIEQLFGGRDQDDPILFRTDEPPTNKLMKYDVENLGAFDLAAIEDVTVTIVKNGVIKEM